MVRIPADQAFEDGPSEIGPLLDDEVLTREQCMRALRQFRRQKIPLAEIARQAGYKPQTLLNAFHMDRIGPKMRRRMTWIIRGLQKKHLVVVSVKGKGVLLLPSKAALKQPHLKARLERCACVLYATCPCGALKPWQVAQWRRPSRLDAVEKAVAESTPVWPRNQSARHAAPLGVSGSLSASRSGITGLRTPTKT